MKIKIITKTGTIRRYQVKDKKKYFYNEDKKAYEKIQPRKRYSFKIKSGETVTQSGDQLRLWKRTRQGYYKRDKLRVNVKKPMTKSLSFNEQYVFYAKVKFKGRTYRAIGYSKVAKWDKVSYKEGLKSALKSLQFDIYAKTGDPDISDIPLKAFKVYKVRKQRVIA